MKGRFKARIDGFLCAQGGIGDAVLHLLKLAGQGAAHPAVCELSPAGLTSLLQVTLTSLLFACVSYLWWHQGMHGRVALFPLLACMTFKSRGRLVLCLHCVTLCVCWVGLPVHCQLLPHPSKKVGGQAATNLACMSRTLDSGLCAWYKVSSYDDAIFSNLSSKCDW